MTDEETFLQKVEKQASGCWYWTGAIGDSGYGIARLYGKQHHAHRVSYMLFVGPIPDAMVIDHLCNHRQCVNPEHLEPVTNAENIRRAVKRREHWRKMFRTGERMEYVDLDLEVE